MTMNNLLGNENDSNNYKTAIDEPPLQDETFDREKFCWNSELEERAPSSTLQPDDPNTGADGKLPPSTHATTTHTTTTASPTLPSFVPNVPAAASIPKNITPPAPFVDPTPNSIEEMAKSCDNEMQEGSFGSSYQFDLDGNEFLLQVENIYNLNIESSQQRDGKVLVENEMVQSCGRKMEEDVMHVAYYKRDEQKPTLIGDESKNTKVLFRALRELSLEFDSIEDEERKRTFLECFIDGAQQTFNKRICISLVHDESSSSIDEEEGQSCEFQDRSNSEDSQIIYECLKGGFNSITPFDSEANLSEDSEANLLLDFGVDVYQQPTVVQYVENYTTSDVLFGKGTRSNNHPGNAAYLEFARNVKDEYKNVKTNKEKNRIVEKVIEFIQSKNGRFLKYDKSQKKWFIAELKAIKKKIAQGIRENGEKSKQKAQTS